MQETESYEAFTKVLIQHFQEQKDTREAWKTKGSIKDMCMAAYGIFVFKYPSLLQYDEEIKKKHHSEKEHNFKTCFGVIHNNVCIL